jgi:hypothetical protein
MVDRTDGAPRVPPRSPIATATTTSTADPTFSPPASSLPDRQT